MLSDDFEPILAGTKIKQTDLTILIGLTTPANGPLYIANANLSLGNLSFIYRHALLARTLGIKIADWETLLYLLQQDVFADPATTWAFLKFWDRIKASGFSIDQLDYILSAGLTARSAVADKSITAVLATLQKSLQGIAAANNPANIPTTADGLTAAILAQLQTLGWDQASATAAVGVITGQVQQQRSVSGMPAGFGFPAVITAAAPDRRWHCDQHDPNAGAISLHRHYDRRAADPTPERPHALLSHWQRLLPGCDQRFLRHAGTADQSCDPFFTAPLAVLPSTVQLGALTAPLSAKVSYDTDLNELTFMGIMSSDELVVLNNLSNETHYHAAVQSLFNQPRSMVPPQSEQWLTLAALATPLTDPPNTVANLTLAELGSAAVLGLNSYVVRKLSTDQVMQQLAAGLALTQAIVDYLVTQFLIFGPVPKHVLLTDFLDPAFVNASSAVTADGFSEIFQGYRWLTRIALVAKTLAMGFSDL